MRFRVGLTSTRERLRATEPDPRGAQGRSSAWHHPLPPGAAHCGGPSRKLCRLHGRLPAKFSLHECVFEHRVASEFRPLSRRTLRTAAVLDVGFPVESLMIRSPLDFAVRCVAIAVLAGLMSLGGCARETPYEWRLPPGFPPPRVP